MKRLLAKNGMAVNSGLQSKREMFARFVERIQMARQARKISVIPELSPRTVQKHLEHTYQKIGVESRTAAAAKAYEIASITSKQTANFTLLLATSLIT